MTIEYSGDGVTTVEDLLNELGMRVNPPTQHSDGGWRDPNDEKADDIWHAFSLQAIDFLKYCSIDKVCGDIKEESQRQG